MTRKDFFLKKGFTLIELLVVISIISLLSSIIISSLRDARNKAAQARVKVEIREFNKVAMVAQGESAKYLSEITGSSCSDCNCRGRDVRNVPTSDACYIGWLNILNNVQNATNGTMSGITNMTRDPWGSPYGLDENEGEAGVCTTQDRIRSFGPDGTWGTGDDLIYFVPLSGNCP